MYTRGEIVVARSALELLVLALLRQNSLPREISQQTVGVGRGRGNMLTETPRLEIDGELLRTMPRWCALSPN